MRPGTPKNTPPGPGSHPTANAAMMSRTPTTNIVHSTTGWSTNLRHCARVIIARMWLWTAVRASGLAGKLRSGLASLRRARGSLPPLVLCRRHPPSQSKKNPGSRFRGNDGTTFSGRDHRHSRLPRPRSPCCRGSETATPGLLKFTIVGLADKAVAESRERARSPGLDAPVRPGISRGYPCRPYNRRPCCRRAGRPNPRRRGGKLPPASSAILVRALAVQDLVDDLTSRVCDDMAGILVLGHRKYELLGFLEADVRRQWRDLGIGLHFEYDWTVG